MFYGLLFYYLNKTCRWEYMKVYNTMSRKIEDFVPIETGKYSIYLCGPTVYNFIHIGNARPLCVFDTLRRYLMYKGNEVLFVSNVTDIDDKLILKAQQENTSVSHVATLYEAEYFKDAQGLNVLRPTIVPHATEYMQDIIKLIDVLIKKDYAYIAENGDVYFRAKKDMEYGKLSHLQLEDLQSGRELYYALDEKIKEMSCDFALWKAVKPGEVSWQAPWGEGRPGWHIECSAMILACMGKTIDLHCGGQDLIFPHHENEIAQSECANDAVFAHYWMHNGFLNIDNKKMSKSTGNFFTVREIAEKVGYDVIRYFMLSAHYRKPINFSMDILDQCKAGLERLYTCHDNLKYAIEHFKQGDKENLVEISKQTELLFCQKMDDDLNTPDALAVLFDFVREINTYQSTSTKEALQVALNTFNTLLGVLGIEKLSKEDNIPEAIITLAEQRKQARKEKDWAKSDNLRDELLEHGYLVEDTADGYKLNKK